MRDTLLVGRERELQLLAGLLDRVPERGGALVVRGGAGIGKSALLAATDRGARERGMLVLTTSGVQSESDLPFAGLHLLLRPVLGGVKELPAPQRAALEAAFGMTDAAAPELFLIALATLELLSDTAAKAPLLIIVEDAQWLDRPSADVLTFVARRLGLDPLILIAAVRDGLDSAFDEAGLPELRLEGLDADAAAAVLDACAPNLTAALRARVLAESVGNPLALVELPTSLAARQVESTSVLPAWLPLTTRLE